MHCRIHIADSCSALTLLGANDDIGLGYNEYS